MSDEELIEEYANAKTIESGWAERFALLEKSNSVLKLGIVATVIFLFVLGALRYNGMSNWMLVVLTVLWCVALLRAPSWWVDRQYKKKAQATAHKLLIQGELKKRGLPI